jgi:hypothetical protein
VVRSRNNRPRVTWTISAENIDWHLRQSTATTFAVRQDDVLDGMIRHLPEGMNFKARSENIGLKQAEEERDQGAFDWTQNKPIKISKLVPFLFCDGRSWLIFKLGSIGN